VPADHASGRTRPGTALAAAALGVAAFLLYRATLLPGMDLGDTPSFQTMVGEPVITPRDAYPLYYALAGVFVWLAGGEAAGALNLFSSVCAAAAVSLIARLAIEMSGSVGAGITAALAFATSYTFWSQAVIAEVYALHIAFVALTALLLLGWGRAPSPPRLMLFFAAYAVGFGNHLSMILLAPGYGAYLLMHAPGGWRSMLRPRVLGMASAAIVAGALPYLWNFAALWAVPVPPATVVDALRTFWFDVTKSDWRDSMVFEVPPAILIDRIRMCLFDVQQQFGWIWPVLAVAGFTRLARADMARAVMIAGVFAATAWFAVGYNVGDPYIFFLPSHLMIALAAAPGLAWLGQRRQGRWLPAAVMLALSAVRAYDNYPALDRSGDRRPEQLLSKLTAGVSDRNAILLSDLDWQVQNGLTYFSDRLHPDIATARLSEVMLQAPALIADNLAIGREVLLTQRAAARLHEAYGPLFEPAEDPRLHVEPLSGLVQGVPPGTLYVLTRLRQSREFEVNDGELDAAVGLLTGGVLRSLPVNDYVVLAGQFGDAPRLVRDSPRPFRDVVRFGALPIEIRMDSWLGFDTIRRMGFGSVIAARRRVLVIERGVGFVALTPDGAILRSGYAWGIFAPEPRFVLRRGVTSGSVEPR
jgi:hypothetical protein